MLVSSIIVATICLLALYWWYARRNVQDKWAPVTVKPPMLMPYKRPPVVRSPLRPAPILLATSKLHALKRPRDLAGRPSTVSEQASVVEQPDEKTKIDIEKQDRKAKRRRKKEAKARRKDERAKKRAERKRRRKGVLDVDEWPWTDSDDDDLAPARPNRVNSDLIMLNTLLKNMEPIQNVKRVQNAPTRAAPTLHNVRDEEEVPTENETRHTSTIGPGSCFNKGGLVRAPSRCAPQLTRIAPNTKPSQVVPNASC